MQCEFMPLSVFWLYCVFVSDSINWCSLPSLGCSLFECFLMWEGFRDWNYRLCSGLMIKVSCAEYWILLRPQLEWPGLVYLKLVFWLKIFDEHQAVNHANILRLVLFNNRSAIVKMYIQLMSTIGGICMSSILKHYIRALW